MIETVSLVGQAGPGWVAEEVSGRVEELHSLSPPAEPVRTVRVMRPTESAIVLGSSQPDSDVDIFTATERGLSLVRRRSGGGAVLVVPGEQLWVDFAIPRGDPLWSDDIVGAAGWVGDAWADSLASLGLDDLRVHRGRLLTTTWSPVVCFAGVGPGEVVSAGRKVMGLSQRRTRDWTRIQSAVHMKWRPEVLVGSLSLDTEQRRECLSVLRGAVTALGTSDETALRVLMAALPD